MHGRSFNTNFKKFNKNCLKYAQWLLTVTIKPPQCLETLEVVHVPALEGILALIVQQLPVTFFRNVFVPFFWVF